MTWTAIGATNPPAIQGHNSTTFSLTPGGVGNLILLEIADAGAFCTGPTSSNVTWTQVGINFTASSAGVFFMNLWAGKVTSTSTATVTMNGVTGTTTFASGQEFSSTVGSWAVDVTGTVNSATASYATLTPNHGAGELYYGYTLNGGAASAGSTSGYVYGIDAQSNGDCFDLNCANSAQTPTWADSNAKSGICVLMYETSGAVTLGPPVYPTPSNRVVTQVFQAGRMGAGHSR